MRKINLSSLLIVTFIAHGFSTAGESANNTKQVVSVSGRVIQTHPGDALSFFSGWLRIIVRGTDIVAWTDEDGYYSIDSIAPGIYNLDLWFLGVPAPFVDDVVLEVDKQEKQTIDIYVTRCDKARNEVYYDAALAGDSAARAEFNQGIVKLINNTTRLLFRNHPLDQYLSYLGNSLSGDDEVVMPACDSMTFQAGYDSAHDKSLATLVSETEMNLDDLSNCYYFQRRLEYFFTKRQPGDASRTYKTNSRSESPYSSSGWFKIEGDRFLIHHNDQTRKVVIPNSILRKIKKGVIDYCWGHREFDYVILRTYELKTSDTSYFILDIKNATIEPKSCFPVE